VRLRRPSETVELSRWQTGSPSAIAPRWRKFGRNEMVAKPLCPDLATTRHRLVPIRHGLGWRRVRQLTREAFVFAGLYGLPSWRL
jgi:hypothetical protein